MIFHENRLLADDSHEISFIPYFIGKLGKLSQNLTSAAVVIGALRVKSVCNKEHTGLICNMTYVMFSCVFVTFACGVLGQVWYLIVSIPDLCLLTYFYKVPYITSKMIFT